MPIRVRRKRTKGWRMKPGSRYVGRPSIWGNPFAVGESGITTRKHAAELYDIWINRPEQRWLMDLARKLLRGRDLACWCPLEEPCHADVLLKIANVQKDAVDEHIGA